MAYVPTVWKNGDIITDAKLNKIEQGIAGCYMPVFDLANCMKIGIHGLVFKTSGTSRMYVTLYSIDSDTAPLREDKKYIFYSAAPEIINAIALSTPMLILDTDRTINYVGIGYATEQSFNGASDLEEDEESDFITFNGSCTSTCLSAL
jgi:hypothetical protein